MERQVKVFVSSTFLGMGDEREVLADFVFPELRKRCAERKIDFMEIDLRWGATKDNNDPATISVCLQRVDESTHFLGMLGERYGTPLAAEQVAACGEYPMVKKHQDCSATELEILQVLSAPDKQALFYFRDPSYKDFVQKKVRDEYDDKLANRNKQDDLKQRIRDQHCKITDYQKPNDLKDLVIEQLWALIDKQFPEDEELSKQQLENFEHDNFAKSLQAVYMQQDSVFTELTKFIEQSDSPLLLDNWGYVEQGDSPLMVVGETGIGKSALLACWGTKYRQAGNFWHFCGCSEASTDPVVVIQRLHENLQQRYQFNLTEKIPYATEVMSQKLEEFVKQDDKPVVVIIDGLNQLEIRQGTVDWLLDLVPPSVRLIVSGVDNLQGEVVKVLPLTASEKRELVVSYLDLYSKVLPNDYIDLLCDAFQTDNPLFLRIILEELRLFNGNIQDFGDKLESYYLEAQTLPKLYNKVLNRLEKDFLVRGKTAGTKLSLWQKFLGAEEDKGQHFDFLVEDAVGLLAVSRFGIKESELLELLQVPQWVWSPLYLVLPLVNRSGLLSFANDYIREAVEKRYGDVVMAELRERLVDYFAKQSVDGRVVDELLFHLLAIGDMERLLKYIEKIPVLVQFVEDGRDYELLGYWHQLGKQNAEVVEIYLQELIEYEKTGSYDDLGYVLNTIVIFCEHIGFYTEKVISLAHRTLNIRKKVLGLQHHSIASLLNKLAGLLETKGDYEQAEPLYRQALEIHKQVLGLQHPDTAISLDKLAGLLETKGDHEQAESLYRQALEISKQVFGLQHPAIASLLNKLAGLLETKGDYEQAEPLYRQALEIHKQVLGLQHLNTATSLDNLAGLLETKGDYEQAESLYRKALEIRTDILGSQHPDTNILLKKLVEVLRKMGNYNQIESLSWQMLETPEYSDIGYSIE
ncbi:tetratricopeptide repeat protein [Candidatus Halobeggiatoa sp. HSG11]|nr:tetratricopeptide repeat protein [Candidatus Halobeggiatoa sp. HSG11]